MSSDSTQYQPSWNNIRASTVSMRTSNPIRRIVDQLDMKNINADKPLISLSIGDPTVFGNLHPDANIIDSVSEALRSGANNGYPHSCGYSKTRSALAEYYTRECNGVFNLNENDIIVTSGCSGALDIAITALANEGDNILIPQPGFSLYQTLCDSKGIECRFYNLDADKNWEADLQHMASLIDHRTRAILVNNPSNPCGSVYSKEHLEEIVKVAERYCLPIIADEIYAHMVFDGSEFHRIATLATKRVPVLSVNGLAKQYLVPGWRVGWITVYDDTEQQVLKEVREGILRLTTLILGANSLVQASIPQILEKTPESFYKELNSVLQKQAFYSMERIEKIPGLDIIRPQGAMYVMVRIDAKRFSEATNGEIADDVEFCKALLKEESLVVLPGQCFRMKNFFRIVFCPPIDKLEQAYDRLDQFCKRKLGL